MYLTSEDVQLVRLSKITLPLLDWRYTPRPINRDYQEGVSRGITPLWFPFFQWRKPAGHYLSKRRRFLQCLFQIVVWGTLVLHVPMMGRINHKIWGNPPSFSVFGLQLSFILLLLSLCKVTPIEDQLQGDLHSSKPSNSNCDGPAWVWWSVGVGGASRPPRSLASRSWLNPWPQVCVSQRTGDILEGQLALFSFLV